MVPAPGPYHGDLHGIAEGNLAGQVVVQAQPRQARRSPWDRRFHLRKNRFARTARRPDADREHPEGDPPVEILPKHEPCQNGGQSAFEVEQQGS